MRILSSGAAQIDTLITKPAGISWLDQRRRLAFATEKLILSAVALAVASLLFMHLGIPTPTEALLFAFLCMPLFAAACVMRSGSLMAAQLLSLGGLAGASLLVGLAASRGTTAASLLLVTMALDGAFLFDDWRRASRAPLAAAFVFLVILSAHPNVSMPADIAAAGMFIATVAVLAIAFRAQKIFSDLQSAATRDQNRFKALVEASGGVVALLDRAGAVQKTTAAQSCSTPVPEIGVALLNKFDEADRRAFSALVDCAIVTGEPQSDSFRGRSTVAVDISLAVVEGGSPDELLALVRQAPEQLESQPLANGTPSKHYGSELKTEFLANVSHELRTPLNAIIGFSEILASHTIRPIEQGKQREYATIIHESGQHLLAVINSILDMSKLRSGSFTLICEPFDVAPLVKQCCDMVKLKAETNRVTLATRIAANVGEFDGDRRALKQILLNLLSNAVRFTPEGGDVRVEIGSDADQLTVVVSDTGIGIGESDLSNLGQPFFQARSSLCRPFEGTGLGLSVVRGLVDLQGGSFTVASQLGKGTTVTIRLPRAQTPVANTNNLAELHDHLVRTDPPRTVGSRTVTSNSFEPRMKQIA